MHKRAFGYIILLIVLTLTTTCADKTLIRKDLKGGPLIEDDFTYILGEKTYDAFAMKATVDEWFKNGTWVKRNAFFSSENPDMTGRWDLKTEEFLTDDVRYVYFEGIYYEIRKGINGFTSLQNNSMTIRGIKIGDSIDDVFAAYGKTEWVEKRKEKWYSGWLGYDYRYYYDKELNGVVKHIYDCIEFEFHDGIVVGIYYHFMNSDEP